MNYEGRRSTILDKLGTAYLVTEAKNRRYLSGFSGSAGWLLVRDEDAVLFTDGRYWDQVERECPGVSLFKFEPKKHKDLGTALSRYLKDEDFSGSLALDTHGMSLATFRSLSKSLEQSSFAFQESKDSVISLRACKDQEEIDLLQSAADIADKALAKALEGFGPGKRECDLKAELEYQIQKWGGTSTSFATIVASGPNGSFPHAGASERVIGEGELITVDFGAVYRGYCSDMTRTIWYGELAQESHDLLFHTRKAQQLAVEAVRPGLAYGELDGIARNYLAEHDLADYFVHSLGHGVGLDIHEAPGLRATSQGILEIGQVVTIEPGLYIPGKTGCRVEDTVVVTPDGCRSLNRFPKQAMDSRKPVLPVTD